MANHREYYKVEGDDLFEVQAMMNFVNPCMLVVRSRTKSASTLH